MTTQTGNPSSTQPDPASAFHWPIENEGGRWESLDPWARPLAGVRVEGEHLCLEYRKPYVEGRAPLELATADFKMLATFADLCIGDSTADGRLLTFASRYGGLGLCAEHGWPFCHTRPHCPTKHTHVGDLSTYRERIGDWLFFSRIARAVVVALTTRAKDKLEPALAELREFISTSSGTPGRPTAWEPYRVILQWLAGGELKIWFGDRPPRLTLWGAPPLWSAIGLELATLAVGARGIVLCSACGKLDSTKRLRTNPNRRSYCSKCRNKGRKRQGVADYRERVRQVGVLRDAGKSIAEIADLVGIEQKRIKRYLAKGA
jgi:hypothetical protein